MTAISNNPWIGIVLAAIPLVVKLIADYRQFLRRKAVNHGREWRWLALAEIPAALWMGMRDYDGVDWDLFAKSLAAGVMFATWIWLLFSGIYNLLRNYGFWFIGSPDTDPGWYSKDSNMEKFLRKIGPTWHVVVKVGSIAVTTFIYIILIAKT